MNKKKIPPQLKQVEALKRQGMTYDQIGAMLGLSKQRVQQIYSHSTQYLKRVQGPLIPDGEVSSIFLNAVVIPTYELVTTEDYKLQEGWRVYVLMRHDQPLYVGRTQNYSRPLGAAPSERKYEAIQKATHVRIYWCQDKRHADALEVRLMVDLHPVYNRRQMAHYRHINGIPLPESQG